MKSMVRCPVCGEALDWEKFPIFRNGFFSLPVIFAGAVTGCYYIFLHRLFSGIVWAIRVAVEQGDWITLPPLWYVLAAVGARYAIAYKWIYPPIAHNIHLSAEGRGEDLLLVAGKVAPFGVAILLLDIPGWLLLRLLGKV